MATRQEIISVGETPTFWNFDEKFGRVLQKHLLRPRSSKEILIMDKKIVITIDLWSDVEHNIEY